MFTAAIEAEIEALAQCYGTPQRVVAQLEGSPFDPLTRTDRYGEVCMIIRRPNGRLITAIKTFYPQGAFRLLTGGISHGEAIEAALLRETAEETSLDVQVLRFLAVIEYHLHPDGAESGKDLEFATFAFLLEETGGELNPQDEDERIGAFREVEVAELPTMAELLDHVADDVSDEIRGSWRDWGHFRAVVHRVTYAALAG